MTMLPGKPQVLEAVSPILSRHGIPGAAIALVTPQGTELVGAGRLEAGGEATVLERDCFQIASLSKAYTATAAATLVARGEIAWDDPVRRHLPEFRLHDEHVSALATVRDLLSMRLGLKGEGVLHWGRNHELGVETILDRLPHVKPAAGFRETMTYYNSAYTLLAEIVSRRSGMRYEDYLREAVFAPIGLADSFLRNGRTEAPAGKRCAVPHVVLDEGVVSLGELRCGGHAGESCIYSSAHDAARWMVFHLSRGRIDGQAILPEAIIAEMHQPHVLARGVSGPVHDFIAYAMGWQVRDTPHGAVLVHEGGELGISSYVILHPATGTGVTVYLNVNIPAASRGIANVLHDMMNAWPGRDWDAHFTALAEQENSGIAAYMAAAFPTDGEDPEIAEIEGEYFDPVNGAIEVRAGTDGLTINVLDGWIYDGRLLPLGGGTYRIRCHYAGMRSLARGMDRIRFQRNGDGGMTLTSPGLGTLTRGQRR